MNLRLYFPVKGFSINQLFGQNATPLYKELGMLGHNGIDFGVPNGTKVRAAHDGIVTFAGEDGMSGYTIVVRTTEQYDYPQGQPDTNRAYFKTLYCHLKADGLLVRAGQPVKIGDVIALSNNTGASTGPHLHFGLKPVQKGEQDWQFSNIEQDAGYRGAIDPEPFWTGIHAEDVPTVVSTLQAVIADLKALIKARWSV